MSSISLYVLYALLNDFQNHAIEQYIYQNVDSPIKDNLPHTTPGASFFPTGSILCPTGNTGGHDYDLERPFLASIIDNGRGLRRGFKPYAGRLGNHPDSPTQDPSVLRFASPLEILEMCKKYQQNICDYLLSCHDISTFHLAFFGWLAANKASLLLKKSA